MQIFCTDEMSRNQKESFFAGFCNGMDALMETIEDSLERREIVEQRLIREELEEKCFNAIQELMLNCGIEGEEIANGPVAAE
jgi:hypothetical protein